MCLKSMQETHKHFRIGTPLKATRLNNIRGHAGIPGARGIAEVTPLRSVTPDVYRCTTDEDRASSSQVKSNALQHLTEIWMSCA